MDVQAEQLEAGQPGDALDQRGRLAERDAELRLSAARVDRRVRQPRHGRVDADQDPLAAGPEAHEPVDVVGVVDDDQADAGGQRVGDVAVALGVAVQQDVRRVEPGRQRDRELARGGDVAAEPLARQDPQQRRAGQRLGGEVHLGGRVAGAERVAVLAGALAQALLVEDEGGRPELGGDVGEGAPADAQAPVGVPCSAVAGRTPRRPAPALVVMAGQYRPGRAAAQSPPPARPGARSVRGAAPAARPSCPGGSSTAGRRRRRC